jgi:hypothetical protein
MSCVVWRMTNAIYQKVILLPFFSGHDPFLVVPSGDVVVVVLSTGGPAGAVHRRSCWCCQRSCHFFNWDLSYNTAYPIGRSLFLSHLLSIFLELLRACLRRNEGQFSLLHCCDVKGVDLRCWRMSVYLVLGVCVLLEWSREQIWCYIPYLILSGMPYWSSSVGACLG